jgi:hypothetical protein
MNYVPINGLRMLAIEASILFATAVLSFLFFRYVRWPVPCPRWLDAILSNNIRAVILVIAVALVGRALLLPWVGIPQPRVDDEYSNLLMADTFAHFRLANPTPPAWQHFETFHVNMVPTYHSKYPVSQGLALGVGEIVFHQPWIGVYFSTALLCGAICWALQAFVPPGWALLGGLLAAFRLALFSYWMNSYWGGSMAALGGALALGAVVRIFAPEQAPKHRATMATIFAIALLLLANSRPYEGFAFALPLIVYFAYQLTRTLLRHESTFTSTAVPVIAIGVAGLMLMGYYNRQTTGNALLLPHLLNERVYSPLPLFLWQKPKSDMTFHDPIFAKFFQVTEQEYGYEKTKSFSGVFDIETSRLATDWFFFCGVALSLPVLIGILSACKQPRLRIVVFVAASTAMALGLCTYTMFHYAAPLTVTVYIFAAEGLRYLWDQRATGERAFAVAVCVAVVITALARQTGSAAVNSAFALPDTRALVAHQLEALPGKHLVLVTYDLDRHYPGDELVHNWADFNSQKILWARSKGAGDDADLCSPYSDRTFWSVTTDDVSYSLRPLALCSASGTASGVNP